MLSPTPTHDNTGLLHILGHHPVLGLAQPSQQLQNAGMPLPARRLLFAGAFAIAIAGAPAVAVFAEPTVHPASRTVADGCPGDVSLEILNVGAPLAESCGSVLAPGGGGGAPTQDALTACGGNRPGCLSDYFYGPGRVQVPNVDTRVKQSQ